MLLSNCNVVDVENGLILENHCIEVKDDQIVRVDDGHDSSHHDSNSIDMNGRFVLPGLINAHNNISAKIPATLQDPFESQAISVLRCFRRAYDGLIAGTTTMRLVGELNCVDIHLRNMINIGSVKGPNLVCAGRALGVSGGPQTPLGVDCDGADEFRKAARKELYNGADFIKIFVTNGLVELEEGSTNPLMTKSEIAAIAETAKSRQTYVTAHAASSEAILVAIASGVSCIEHAFFLNREAAKSIKEVNGYLCPTISAIRSADWRRSNGYSESTIQKLFSVADRHMESVRMAISEGVTIVCGADLPPGELNDGVNVTVREMEFLKEAGLEDLEVLRSATTTAAKLCKMQHSVGLVRAGFKADLIATQHDPLKDIRKLEQISFVMKSGEILRDDS